MKLSIQVVIAATLWLTLLIPLWYSTILVRRADLDLDELSRYELVSQGQLLAYIPIAIYGESLPDIAPASEKVLNAKLDKLNADRRFVVSSKCSDQVELCVNVKVGRADSFSRNSDTSELEISVSEKSMANGNIPELIVHILFDSVYHDELNPTPQAHDEVTVGYSPRYHVTFSLLGEGGAVLNWQISEALEQYIVPLLSEINVKIANITVDTQTGLYAKLGCPRSAQIPKSSLSTFVDFAEWSLASSISYPTLNFVYYVPTSLLEIGDERTNSFIVPQWGGIIIASSQSDHHNFTVAELKPVIEKFSSQLLALLGMREYKTPALDINAWYPSLRIAKLSRSVVVKGISNAASSLGSLKRLTESMPLIPIPTQVSVRARSAASEINEALQYLREGKTELAANYAARAFENADKAFFDKHMVAQAHFPDEQKLAVYMPLIGPLCIVVISGWLRIYKSWKAGKQAGTNENEIKPKEDDEKKDKNDMENPNSAKK